VSRTFTFFTLVLPGLIASVALADITSQVQSAPPTVTLADEASGASITSGSDGSSESVEAPTAIEAGDEPSDFGPTLSNALDEEEIKQLIEEYLAERDAMKEASLTPEEKKKKELAMTAEWNNGLELSTKNKHFRTHIGGRYQFDTAWFGAPQNVNNAINVPYGDGVDFRRARLRIDGTLYEVHEYACEYDFVNSARVRNQPGTTGFFDEALTAPTDLWWQIKKVPLVGNVKIGSQKEQIGFEHIVSSRFQPLMERSFNQDTFYGGLFNGFQPGITIFDTYGDDEDGVWNLGLFKPTNNIFSSASGDGDYAVSGRLTRLLFYGDEGRQLLHVGISGRQASAVQQAGIPGKFQTYRTRDAIRSGLSAGWPVPAGITLLGDDTQWVNGELVSVYGPLTWQSEYLVSGLQDARLSQNDAGQTVTYHGGYAQIGLFLTGENDNYVKKNGAFERVHPHSNFFSPNRCGGITGCGAWQAVVRYNHLDLNDGGLNGGILDGYTAGMNWFWNPNMKMQFNYNITDRDVSEVAGRTTGSGRVYGYGSRIAMDF
jgi:phosphate-selective porin OprO and OprP